jgi:hypothetical protein
VSDRFRPWLPGAAECREPDLEWPSVEHDVDDDPSIRSDAPARRDGVDESVFRRRKRRSLRSSGVIDRDLTRRA